MVDAKNEPRRGSTTIGHVTLADRRQFLIGAGALGAATLVSGTRGRAQGRAEISMC